MSWKQSYCQYLPIIITEIQHQGRQQYWTKTRRTSPFPFRRAITMQINIAFHNTVTMKNDLHLICIVFRPWTWPSRTMHNHLILKNVQLEIFLCSIKSNNHLHTPKYSPLSFWRLVISILSIWSSAETTASLDILVMVWKSVSERKLNRPNDSYCCDGKFLLIRICWIASISWTYWIDLFSCKILVHWFVGNRQRQTSLSNTLTLEPTARLLSIQDILWDSYTWRIWKR